MKERNFPNIPLTLSPVAFTTAVTLFKRRRATEAQVRTYADRYGELCIWVASELHDRFPDLAWHKVLR